MNSSDLALLAAAGALPQPARDTSGAYVSPQPKSAIGYRRQVNGDGSVSLAALCFDGTEIAALIPAPGP